MVLGKEVRLRRLINPKSNRFVAIAIDHAMARGVLPGLVNVKETLSKICDGKPDAITMHKGIAENLYGPYAGKIPFILKATTFSPYHKNYDTSTADVEEAVRLGADAISVGVIVGGPEQAEQITHLARISKEASKYGMPLVAHIYPRGSEIKDQNDPDMVAYAVRVGAELGVDIIKTNWTGSPETFEKVVQACPAKVVIAGGSPGNNLESYLKMTWEGVQVGIFGVTYGRFVWQDPKPAAVIAAVKAIVHDNATVKEAMEIYRSYK
ncbi:2-amino-3,7-dideoxy-D-threo-hept-6-ulosonate synthase [Thermovorax subterraneus]|nr:2-amino-3,7-dideoxy-D-threo-hept-6-ulosonate synthase [Thermovorax subterraneus]